MKDLKGKFVAMVFSGEKAPVSNKISLEILERVKKSPNEFQAVKDSEGNFHVIKFKTKD